MAEAQGNTGGHQYLTQIIDVAAQAPEAAGKEASIAVGNHLGPHAKKGFIGLGFVIKLLHVCSAGKTPSREENDGARPMHP